MTVARVLHVGPFSPPIDGGISAYLDGLRRAAVVDRVALEAFDVHARGAERRSRVLRARLTVRLLWRFRSQLSRTTAQLVHVHTSAHLGFWEKSLYGLVAARHGFPFLLHVHGGDFDRFIMELGPLQRRLAGRVFRAACGIIVLSQAWKHLFEPWVVPERLHVVPNAIHVADFPAAVEPHNIERVRILFVGMLSARKGLDELCLALVTLGDTTRPIDVEIVGGEEVPGDAARYRQCFRQAGLTNVHFHGLLDADATREQLRRAHVFVLPSRSESFGIANLEAMACGLPVVSTRTGAIPEYIEHDVHGLLVDPGDAAGLARELRRLIESPKLRQRLGAAARERAQRFDWTVVGPQLESIYRRILGL